MSIPDDAVFISKIGYAEYYLDASSNNIYIKYIIGGSKDTVFYYQVSGPYPLKSNDAEILYSSDGYACNEIEPLPRKIQKALKNYRLQQVIRKTIEGEDYVN